ncbi:hypothetical protein FGO68_gene6376 [Halteria grandinella]|uniref:Uncharacterized protein n=1 Tax=Halteria grandinella TaxID=5974 RepID=A0A8J8NCE2_HALGN|nr:hypothetical protein FGO68_gene6376 [Halteria grandinella]
MRWEVLAFTTSVMLGIFWLPGYFKNKMHEGMTPNQNVQFNPVTMREPQVQRMDVNTLKNNYDQQMANAIRPHQAYQNMSYNGGVQEQPQQQDLPYQQSHTPYNQQQYQNYHPAQGQPAYPGQLSPYEQQQDEIQRRQFAMEVERLQLQSQMKNQQMEEAQKYGGLGGTHGYLK